MTREKHLEFCSICTKRAFNPKVGITCSLTDSIANFEVNCESFHEDEKEKTIKKGQVESLSAETEKEINRGRIAVFVITGLYILGGFFEAFYMPGHDILFGVVDWIIAVIFLGLAIWSFKNPALALTISLVLFVVFTLLVIAFDPSTILKGIIMKVAIIYYLIQGVKIARNSKTAKKENLDLLDDI